MDERLEQALQFSKYRQTLFLEKRRLQEKLSNDLIIIHNGGKFTISRNLIVFLNLIIPDEGTNSVVLLDDNNNPILVEDLAKFRTDISSLYFSVINQYYMDFEDLKKKRTVKAIVDL